MSRKGEAITVSLSLEEREDLESIATQLGYMWGDKPNISSFLRAIASGELQIVKSAGVKTVEPPQPKAKRASKWEGDRDRIERLILSGKTLGQIAVELGVTRQRVQQICQAIGVNIPDLKDERNSVLVLKIKTLAEQGLTVGEIANELGLTYCKIKKKISGKGIKCRTRHSKKVN